MYAKNIDINLLKKIMTTEDLSILNFFGKYLRTCFDIRKSAKENSIKN